ncbi:uncharacterized protein LOC135400455 [Ornithodoros turicata]|uniref:uncharacterized protein LOC135400455 n=1 Tax=Ornithodoros turicata TaxID=34597 RepID=UPI0031394C3A
MTAWILRYVRNSRPGRRTSGPITVTELAEAEKHWTKHVQGQCFTTEITCTLENRKLPANSPLRTVTLFIDKEGLLRINGRLQFSGKVYDEHHPIVLPKTHHLSTLVVRGCHRQLLHSGVRDTMVQVRERHWIVGARQLIKKVIKQCIICQRFRSRPAEEAVPKERVPEALPFEVTGIDLGGPLLVKGKRTTHKSYITLFTCGVTRAIHLEYVEDILQTCFYEHSDDSSHNEEYHGSSTLTML